MKSELITIATAKLQKQVEEELKIQDPVEFAEGNLLDFIHRIQNEKGNTAEHQQKTSQKA